MANKTEIKARISFCGVDAQRTYSFMSLNNHLYTLNR